MKQLFHLLFCMVFILPTSAQTWTYDTLTEDLNTSNVASIGNKIFFYSGVKQVGTSQILSDQLEIFDIQTGTKQVSTLPSGAPRYGSGVTVVGSKVMFAGGYGSTGETTRVDIYDTLTSTWSTAALSAKRRDLAATSTSTKAFFGGGYGNSTYSGVVDIYNSSTNTWTATSFPNATQAPIPPQRTYLTAATIGNKVMFAGGLTVGYRNLVSVYNTQNNSWDSNTNLSQNKGNLSSIVYGSMAYFIGGQGRYTPSDTGLIHPSDTIDIYDGITNNWSVLKIPRLMYRGNGALRPYEQAVLAGCKIFLVPLANIYTGGSTTGNPDTIAIYDLARNTWSYEALPHPRSGVTAVAAKNKVYFAGGDRATAPFSGLNDIDIYTLAPKLQLAVGNTPVVNYSFDFGNLIVGNQLDSQLAVSNEGDYELLFTPVADKISITGDTDDFTIDFSSLQATDTMDPAQILSLPIHFHPTSTGEKSITLQVLSNDPALPTYSFTLQGNGTIASATENSLVSSQTVSIYPIPCSDILQIKISTSFQQASLKLSDLNGKLIHESYDLTSFTQLSTSIIPNGIYLLNVQTDDNRFQSKVVVTH